MPIQTFILDSLATVLFCFFNLPGFLQRKNAQNHTTEVQCCTYEIFIIFCFLSVKVSTFWS